MDTATWMQMGGISGLGAALVAGFVFSFTPVAFASIPVVLAYVTRAREFRDALSYGSAFAAGLILTHVVLGVVAALGGAWAQNLLSRQWGVILGPLLIALGLL
jgi:cytochrome c-type biogenesis protein